MTKRAKRCMIQVTAGHQGIHGYEYDPEERITKVTDSVEGITEYTYDPLGQLTSEKKNGVTTTVTYDTYSNHGGILTKGGKTYSYSNANKDLLVSYNGETISYGTGIYPSPNPVVYRGWNLTWTKGRQLASASGSGKTMSFTYNPNGIRTSKTVNGVKHSYILDGTRLVRDEYNDVDYLYDSERKVCGMVHEGKTYYLLKNLQGDVIALTNEAGMVIARYSYDAWGEHTIWVREENTGSTEYTEQVRSYEGELIINYAPSDKQWWITGFNPNYSILSASLLTAIYTVTFNDTTMYNDFYNTWNIDSRWSFDGDKTATLRF